MVCRCCCIRAIFMLLLLSAWFFRTAGATNDGDDDGDDDGDGDSDGDGDGSNDGGGGQGDDRCPSVRAISLPQSLTPPPP